VVSVSGCDQEPGQPAPAMAAGKRSPLLKATGVMLACLLLLLPGQAWALQAHGAPEGLYVHQMAHVHFIIALAYLYWHISRSTFTGQGWRYLLAFCVLMILWNVLTFVGHAADGLLSPDAITTTGDYLHERIIGPLGPEKILYYIAKFDHLLAVPALFFLFVGMRSLYRAVEKHAGEAEK